MPVAQRAPQHRRPGQVRLARPQNDRLVQRLVAQPVALADEDAQQNGLVWNLHAPAPIAGSTRTPARGPARLPPDTAAPTPSHSSPPRPTAGPPPAAASPG